MPAISKRYAIFALSNGGTVVVGAFRGGVLYFALYFTAKAFISWRR